MAYERLLQAHLDNKDGFGQKSVPAAKSQVFDDGTDMLTEMRSRVIAALRVIELLQH